jgi:hypothetical protein
MQHIAKGTQIIAVMNNAIQIAGVVEVWSEQESILMLKDGSKWIIHNTAKDVMLTKLVVMEPSLKETQNERHALQEEFEEACQAASDDLRVKKLAELKILLNNQEKQIISQKLREHEITEVKPVQYEQPRFSTK